MKILYIFLFLTLFSQYSYAQEETFLRANKLYEEKNYEQSLKMYQSITHKGPAVWYNMGNCAYRLKNDIDALLYWSRARRQATMRQQALIDRNINILLKKDKFSESAMHRIFSTVRYFCLSLSWLLLQLLFLSIWYVGWLSIGRRSFKSKILMGSLVCALSIIGGIKYHYVHEKSGLVTLKDAQLYAGPNEKFQKIGKAPLLAHVSVEKMEEAWCKVRSDSITGWMKKNTLVLI